MKMTFVVLIFATVIFSACAPTQVSAPTATPTQIPTATNTFTPAPTLTPIVSPTPTITPTPTPLPPEPIGLNNINRLQPFAYLASEYQEGWVNLHSVAFSPDGKYLAMGGLLKMELWDWKNNQLVKTVKGWTDSIAFSPDGKLLAYTQQDKAYIVDIKTLKTTQTQNIQLGNAGYAPIIFSPGGQTYAVAGKKIQVYNTLDGSMVKVVDLGTSGYSLSYSSDGAYLAVSAGSQIRVYRLADWKLEKLISLFQYHTPNLNKNYPTKIAEMALIHVAFSPDGKYLAGVSDRLNRTIVIIRTNDWQVVRTITSAHDDEFNVAFTHDSQLITDGYDFYNVETGAHITLLNRRDRDNSWGSIAISPDGTLMAGGFHQVQIWKVFSEKSYRIEWNFETQSEDWFSPKAKLEVQDGNLVPDSWGAGDWMASPEFAANASQFTKIEIRMKSNTSGTAGFNWVYQLPGGEPQDFPDKRKQFDVIGDGNFHTYVLDMSTMPTWQGKIIQIIFGAPSSFAIDYIRLVTSENIARIDPPTPTPTKTLVATPAPTRVPTVSAEIITNPGFENTDGWTYKWGEAHITGTYSNTWASEGLMSYKIALHGDKSCSYYFNPGVRGSISQKIDLTNVDKILFDLNLLPEDAWSGNRIGSMQATVFIDGVQVYAYQGKGGVERDQSLVLAGKYQNKHDLTFSMMTMSYFCSYGSATEDEQTMYIDNIRFIYK